MADLIYSSALVRFKSTKFEAIYHEQTTFAVDTTLFFNNKPLILTDGDNSLALLGCAAPSERRTKDYLEDLLANFSERQIARVKTELAGQWILIVKHDNILYICSDFMQIRPIYYAPQQRLVCSSFGPLHDTVGGEADSYKCFEFLAMRHCLYPAWLGKTTLNPSICLLRGFEYIKIGLTNDSFEVKELTFKIDNTKAKTIDEAAGILRNAVEQIITSPEYHGNPAYPTITGGFDSRLICSCVRKHYSDIRLRIGALGQTQSMDLRIASKIAKIWKLPLDIHKIDLQAQKEIFYQLTDSLTPLENAITTEIVLRTNASRIGFGGVLGTEILTSLPYERIEALAEGYVARIRNNFKPSEEFLKRFREALKEEFSAITAHYEFQSPETEEKDRIRLFMVGITARFSGPQVAAYDIHGRQIEPLATYPALTAGLRIPYLLMGGRGTFGGFYLVPKTIMSKLDKRASLIDSTHFSPMYPFGPRTFAAYIIGKFRQRRHIAAKQQALRLEAKSLIVETPDWTYRTTEWAEGFVNRYLLQYRK